jgi:hypothetical protein
MFCNKFHAVTKRSQIHPNTTKCTETLFLGPMGWIGSVHCEKSRRDFVAWTFALIALVHPVFHRVSCSYEMIPNAPKHYETHQNMSLGSNGVDQVRSSWKDTTLLHGSNFCMNCISLVCFATSFMQLWNTPKHEFRVQWDGSGGCVGKNYNVTSWHELLH